MSTAYSHTNLNRLDEVFYKPVIEVERIIKLVDILDDEDLDKISPTLVFNQPYKSLKNIYLFVTSNFRLMKEWPNTYAFTKALGEEALRLYGRELPVCLVRPSICVSTAMEPTRGWTDCLYGATGICVGAYLCVLRVVECDGAKVAEIIPIDYVCNNMIVCAWDTYNDW